MTLSFSPLQVDLLIGTLLGDGNLQTINGQKWRLCFVHKAAHESYVMHKYSIFKDFCNTEPKYAQIVDEKTNKTYSRYFFSTLFLYDFRFYGQLFYKKEHNGSWKKRVPKNIDKFLTPRALAYWYMDHGALKWKGRSNAVRFCTDSFTYSEVNVLKKALEKNFGLKISLQKKNERNRLCVLENSYPKLKELIVPYLIPSMYYKFPDGNKGIYENEDISNDLFNTFDDEL